MASLNGPTECTIPLPEELRVGNIKDSEKVRRVKEAAGIDRVHVNLTDPETARLVTQVPDDLATAQENIARRFNLVLS